MDTILRGFISGFFATIVYVAIDWFFYLVGLTPFTVVHYGAVLITPPNTEITAIPLLFGLTAVFIAGSLVGVSISMVIRSTGIDYIYLKSLGSLAVLWIVHVSILPKFVDPELFQVITIAVILFNFLIKFAWAYTYAFLYLRIDRQAEKTAVSPSKIGMLPIPARKYYKKNQKTTLQLKRPKKLK